MVDFSLSSPNLDGSNNPGVSIILMFLFKIGIRILYLLICFVVPIFADVCPTILFNKDLAIDVFPEEPAPKRVTL